MSNRIEILANDPTYLFWAGDGTKNDANSVFYIKNNGDAYFGGSLTAGDLVAQATNNTVSNTAYADTGKFGTGGSSRTITYSIAYNNAGTNTTSLPTSLSCTLTLYRSINGAAFTSVSTKTVTGTLTNEYDPEFHNYDIIASMSGSNSYTDSSVSGTTYDYKVGVSGASNWPVTLISGGSTTGIQSLVVKSVE